MTAETALLILGAGPAGIGAALAATECGLETRIVDAAAVAGGQVYRAMPEGFAPAADLGPDHLEGERQRRLLAESGVATEARAAPGRIKALVKPHQWWRIESGQARSSIDLTAP